MTQPNRSPSQHDKLSIQAKKWLVAYCQGRLNRQQRKVVRHYLRHSTAARTYYCQLLNSPNKRKATQPRVTPDRKRSSARREWCLVALSAGATFLVLATLWICGTVKAAWRADRVDEMASNDVASLEVTVAPSSLPDSQTEQQKSPTAPLDVVPPPLPVPVLQQQAHQPATAAAEPSVVAPRPAPTTQPQVPPNHPVEDRASNRLVQEEQKSVLPPRGEMANTPTFAKDILPIFVTKCVSCHGKEKQSGDLDMRSLASLLKGGASGPSVVPGKPEKSLLWDDIASDRMPPKAKDRLTEVEKERIRQWIADGARDQVH